MRNNKKKKVFRCFTVHTSVDFVEGMIPYLSDKYDLLLLSSPGEGLSNIAEKYGLKYYAVSMARRMAPFKDIVSLFNLVRVFRKEKPDMVHSMTPKAGLLCMMAAMIAGVPIRIHTFTGLVWPTAQGLKRHLLMFTDKLTCGCATHIVPEGQGVLNDLKDHNITKKNLRVLGYGNIQGVDLGRFVRNRYLVRRKELIENYHLEDCFTFIFVGRVVRDKGMNELVSAFAKLNQLHANTRLLLIGRLHKDIDAIAPETQLMIDTNDSICTLGEIFGDELLAHYISADCLVFPSYREGFPNTVLEAGALGLPSIVTDINGSREIIEDGKNGLIVPSKDADALCEAMKYVVENPQETQRMASNARAMIASRFDCYFVRQCLYDYYEQLFEQNK